MSELSRAINRAKWATAEPAGALVSPLPTVADAPQPAVVPDRPPQLERDWLLVGEWAEPDEPLHVGIREIQRLVCLYFNTSRIDMISQRRDAQTVYYRQVAVYLCKRFLTASLPQMAQHFGKRDHTTMLHSINRIEARLKVEPLVAAQIEELCGYIRKRQHLR